MIFKSTSNFSPHFCVLISTIMILAIGVIDWYSGMEQSFSVFYVIPISIVTWNSGLKTGIACAIASTVLAFWGNDSHVITESDDGIILWNTLSPTFIYFLIIYLVNRLKQTLGSMESTVTERTASLTSEIAERKAAEEKLINFQHELSSLTAELSKSEERERRRFATELHDELGQNLAYVNMKLNNLTHRNSRTEDYGTIREIKGIIDRIIESVRSLTFQISTPLLYEIGLTAALEWYAEELRNKHNLAVAVQDDGIEKFDDIDTRAAVFQMVRELLVNVVKHSQSSRALVTIGKKQQSTEIEVIDYGIGFRKSADESITPRTYGLFNVQQRIKYFGGSFSVESNAGKGTRIILQIPDNPAGREDTHAD